MLKNLKRASAIMLSLAMAVQFGLADTYYANTLSEEPIIEETQEQEPVTVEEGSQQVAVEQTEAPAIDAKEEFVQVPETKSVTLSYVAEDGTILQDATTHEYEIDYNLNSDASVMLNFDGYTLKDVVMNDSQIVAAAQANLNVTSDLTSVKFVYQKVMTESHPEANEAQEENKTEEKTEEDAEADPEAKEELPEYPAFDMSATAGNVTVHVTAAEGVLPSGAQLIVKRVTRKAILNAVEETVTEKDKEVDSAIALDITIVNADGIEIQPNGIVNVSFENVAVGGEEVNVYHVTDDASTVTEVATNTQSFDANHFSIYVITGEKKVELTTFNFVAEGNTVSTQIVKTGDTLITPTAPDIAGKAFVEWQENGSKFDGFGVQTITKTETRTITAKYEDALYVYFYNPEGTQIMRTEKVADHKGHNYSHVSYDVDATHKLVGWAADQNDTTNIANSIAVPEGSTSVNVYAIIKEGYWVTFDSDGGSAIDSQFVFDKISLNDQTTPKKPGYTFDGWYNGTEEVENGTQITKPMTLKAHWTPEKVSYTVIHWWENADDNGYSFHESETKKGLTGSETEAVAKSYTVDGKNIFGESVKDKVFTASTISQKTIKGDGSTIVNVYYKRKTYTMHFKEYSNSRTDLSTITKKWGQSISKAEWPAYDGNSNWQIRAASYYGNSQYLAYTSTMPMKDSTLWSTSGKKTYTAYYYVQKIDGNGYDLHHTDVIKGSSYLTIGKEDCYAISGFTFQYCNTDVGESYNGAKFYYKRNSYNLKFINNGKQEKTVSKKYEQSIEDASYTPTRPSSLPEYYVFDGWYENELCEGEAFNFTGKKMPAQNVTLYAKWTASNVKFTYNLNNPEGTVDKDTKKVEAGTVASTVLPSIPTINEYSFAGWYYADGNGNITSEVFHTGSTITRDTSIVGKWLYKGELRVVYDPGTEKDVTVPTDDRVYAGGARVTVAGNATTTSGKKFLGWELNGNVYKPGQSFEVNKDIANKDNQIILTATWGNAETSTTLTYDPGNGIGTVKTVNVMNNEAVEIKAHNSDVLAFTAPVAEGKEYYFAGWADSQTGNATYADGQTINIDANGENVLYAVWVEKTEITLVANSGTRTYNGAEQSIEGFVSTTIDGYTVSGLTAVTKGTDVGEYTNTVFDGTAKVEKDGVDVTNKVVVKTRAGKLVITPKSINTQEITVTKPADSKYDGNVHENIPVVKDTKTGATLVEGTDYTLSYKGDTTNAGTVTVTITGAGNYTGSHNVEYQITKRNVTLTSATDSKVYDKTPLTNSNITIGGDGFAKLEGASYHVTGSQTNVGDSDNEFTYKLNDDTKASNYNIEVKFGKLYITTQDGQVIVVITGHKKTYDYDGTEKTVSGYDVSITEGSTYAEADFTFNGNAEVKATAANTYPMGLKVSDFTNNNTNYSSVTFVVNDGSLVINPKSIIPDKPNTPDEKKTGIEVTNPEDSIYDGLPHVNPLTVTDTKTKTDLEENKDYTLTYSSDVINVGTVEINVKGIGNYTGEFKKSYKITPKEYTVTTDSAKKVYDGTALTAGGKIEGIVDGEVVVVHTTGSQTEVGSTPNTYKLEWKKASSKNYKLKEDSIGTLTVTEQTIDPGKDPDKPNPNYSGVTINNPSNSVYDGKEHKWSPAVADKEGNALAEGTDYEVAYSTSDFTNVTGTITVTISGIGNYTGTVTRTYEITPKAYTVTTDSAKKVYDGTALTAGGKVEGIVSGETVEFTATGSRTDEGTSKNTYSLKWNGSAIETNYKLAKESIGDLTVTPKSIIPDEPNTPDDKKTGITVSNPKDSKYDGQEHREVLTVKDTKTGKDLIANKDYTVVYSDDLVNAGTVTIKVSGLGNYSGSFTKTYKITKRLVTLTSATVSKTYDGQALTNTSITVSGDGFVEGEGASYEVTGTQTSVGNSANAFEYKLNEKTLASNYDITKVVGTLTITAAPAPVTPPTSPTPVSPPPATPRYIQQVVPALTSQEKVKKEKTPKAEPKEEKVEKGKTPKARPEKFWALINLICAIVTVLFGLLLLISKRHKSEDDEEDDDETKQQTNNDDESNEQEKKRGAFTRVLAVLIAILSVVFFLVTEDLSLRWTWTDQWTIWMVVIGFVQIVVFFVGRKWKNVDDDDEEEAQQA